jgi:hypothetical protein
MNTIAKVSFLSFFLWTGLSLFAQDIKEKQYDYRDFSILDVGSAFSVEVTQGSNYKITLIYAENLEDKIKCTVEGDKLKLTMKGGSSSKNSPKALIQMPELKGIDLSGAVSINLVDFKGEEIDIDISGASNLQGKLNYNSLKMDASGASSSSLEGKANIAKLDLSGASKISGKGFIVEGEFVLNCSGASKITMTVDGDMHMKLSGASSFDFYGQGNVLSQETTGASDIHKMDK